jgi:hypothetical protein
VQIQYLQRLLQLVEVTAQALLRLLLVAQVVVACVGPLTQQGREPLIKAMQVALDLLQVAHHSEIQLVVVVVLRLSEEMEHLQHLEMVGMELNHLLLAQQFIALVAVLVDLRKFQGRLLELVG